MPPTCGLNYNVCAAARESHCESPVRTRIRDNFSLGNASVSMPFGSHKAAQYAPQATRLNQELVDAIIVVNGDSPETKQIG
jgi:hypothetical protein